MKSYRIVFGVLACVLAGNAFAYDLLGDWPTKFKTDSGYEFGVKGLYQADTNDFSNGSIDPVTGQPLFGDSTTWRRKEFDVYAKTPSGFEIDLGYDWQGSWVDNYLKYSSDHLGDFRLGQFKTLVGFESTESADAGTFLEPSLPGVAAFEGRRKGLDWSYDKIPQWTLFAAYYSGGDLDGNHKGDGYGARAVYAPIKSDTQVVHLGIAASREYPDDRTAQFSSTPEAALTKTDLVDTKKLPGVNSIDRLGLEAAWLNGPFFAQGEYLRFTANRTTGLSDFTGNGFYAFGAWMLTGESREYKNAEFGNTKPTHKWGAIELALRYSQLDLRDGNIQGGTQHDWTLGLNWYIGQHLKLQADYVWARANQSPANEYLAPIDPRIFELRAQLYF